MTGRVFEHRRMWRLDQPEFTEATRLLARATTQHFGLVDAVIGIARGGTRPATDIATLLGVPAWSVTARHNTNDHPYQPATGRVHVDLTDLDNRARGRVLLVDDIAGSGATLDTVSRALRQHSDVTRAITAVLCRNQGATTTPDLWVWTVADWVVFPWENPHLRQGSTPLPAPETARRT